MIDEDDNGNSLAAAVVSAVRDTYPQVAVDIHPFSEGRWFTTVIFTPENEDGVEITLYANFNWTFDLQVGPRVVLDMEPYCGSEVEQVRVIVEHIRRYAASGAPGCSASFEDAVALGPDLALPQ